MLNSAAMSNANNVKSSSSLKYISLMVWLIIVFAAAAIGSAATSATVNTWYTELNKPSFQPPNWLFGPVWTILYTMMGVSAWLVWSNPNWSAQANGSRNYLIAFFVQLALNTLWSVLFFGQKQIGLALVEIGVLWLAIATTIYFAMPLKRLAGLLLLPYLAWVSFAAILNFALWQLN
jgi:tryptophan-rich sensory protein